LYTIFFKLYFLYLYFFEVGEDNDDDLQEVGVQDVGKKKAFSGRAPRENWPPSQEVALAQAWVQISTCQNIGNEQSRDGFWKRVLDHFKSNVGSTTRTFHSLNTKWKVMNTAMGLFNGLYIQAV